MNDEGSIAMCPFCEEKIMTDPIDPETIQLAMNGDDEAFSSLFMNTYRYVYTVAKHYLSNDEDIYDAIQDTYTKVYVNIKRLKNPEAFHSWLGKIAENASKDILTTGGAARTELDEETEEYLNDGTAQSAEKEVSMDITAVFAQLSAEDAKLLTYIYYDGFKVTEVARMQGLAATTVYSRLNAAKRRLKELLKIKGIEKPIYGGDLVTLITTTIRNAIGTNLLSAAVADEILQSVTGKKTKAGVVISKVARKQRNAAVLRIASLIVLVVVLATGLMLGVYFAVSSALNRSTSPTNGSGSMTVGVSTEIGTSSENGADGTSSTDKTSSYYNDSSNAQSVIGGVTDPNQSSTQSSNSGNMGNVGNPDSTVSQGNTSTGNSGEIGNTGDPDQGSSNIGNTSSSSAATSSQKVSTSVSTTSSGSSSDIETAAVYYLGNTSNNLHNISEGRIAKHGDWIYYTKESYSGADTYSLYKIKTDGTGFAILHTSSHEMTQLNVADGRIYYNQAYRIYTIGTDGSGCKQVSSFSQEVYNVYIIDKYVYATVATEPKTTLYKSAITSGTHSWSVVSGYTRSSLLISDDGKYLYTFGSGSQATLYNYYRYNIATKEETLIAEDVTSRGSVMAFGEYFVYPVANTARTVKYNLISVNNPSKIIATYYPEYQYCQFFSSYKGGSLGFNFDSSSASDGTVYYLSGGSKTASDMLISSAASTFPNDDHIYYIYNDHLYKALPDGSEITCLR